MAGQMKERHLAIRTISLQFEWTTSFPCVIQSTLCPPQAAKDMRETQGAQHPVSASKWCSGCWGRHEEPAKSQPESESASRSVVSDSFATTWTVARQAPLSMGFFRQECWNGLPCPPPRDLPDPGIEPGSPALPSRLFTVWATREATKRQPRSWFFFF